jgi:hypothetical protein
VLTLQVPVEAIEARARQADPRRALLAVLLLVPFALGWVARWAWMAAVYVWSAVVAGWQEAGRPRPAEGGAEV